MENSSIGIIIFVYEFSSLIICYNIIKNDLDQRVKDDSLKCTKEFTYFAKQSFKNFLVDYPAFLAVDGENFVISLVTNNLQAQISVHSLFFNIGSVFFTFFIGFLVLMRTTVNHYIGEKKYLIAKDYFLKYEKLIIGIQVIVMIGLCFAHWLVFIPLKIYENNAMEVWAKKAYLLYFFNSADLGIEAIYNNIIRTFQKQNLLVILQFSHTLEIILSYILAIKYNFGVVGVGIALCTRQIILQIFKRWIIYKSDWGNIKEYNNKNEKQENPGDRISDEQKQKYDYIEEGDSKFGGIEILVTDK